MQTEMSLQVASVTEATGRHGKEEVPVADATDIPDKAEIPCQSEV
jgi:hypothetical protein